MIPDGVLPGDSKGSVTGASPLLSEPFLLLCNHLHRRPQRLPKRGANPTKGAKGGGALSILQSYSFVNRYLYAQMSVCSHFTHSYM